MVVMFPSWDAHNISGTSSCFAKSFGKLQNVLRSHGAGRWIAVRTQKALEQVEAEAGRMKEAASDESPF